MSIYEVERRIIELIYRDPFVPFAAEMTDGRTLEIPHPRLAINGGGAGFIDQDGALVDLFKDVRAIRTTRSEAVA